MSMSLKVFPSSATFFFTLVMTALLVAPPALAARENTNVSIKVSDLGAGEFRYAIKILKSTPRKCRKERKVTVFHDANEDGTLSDGETLIEKGQTNKKGKFNFNSDFEPPQGATIAAKVKKNLNCKAGKASTSTVVPEREVVVVGDWAYVQVDNGCVAVGQFEQFLVEGEGVYQTLTPESQQVSGSNPCSYVTAGDFSNRTVGPIATILKETLTQSELQAAYSAFFIAGLKVKIVNPDKYRVSATDGSSTFTYTRVAP